MEQLSSLLTQAEEIEGSGDLAQAERILQQAVELDSASRQARSELERVKKAHTTQRFNTAMSNGYRALDNGQFEQARSAFSEAATLKIGSAVAASALEDVDSAETAWRLSDLQRQGQAYEAQEQWAAAVIAFEQALQIDNNLVFARDGLKRSRTRARLDQQFHNVIDEPERLSEIAVADATAQLLRQAATISPRGPVLAQQMEQLKVVLERANTTIPLTLHSDTETEVTLRKVARLGRFQERQLNLRPGTYVAVGTREGYRDVRLTFSLSHGSEPPTVVIACTDQI
jgi:tetratricopeptide (TPR) repeat protein